MKTLRLVRNIAVLFILIVALLAWRPRPAAAHATGKSCGFKRGFACSIDASGNCKEEPCGRSAFFCPNFGCV